MNERRNEETKVTVLDAKKKMSGAIELVFNSDPFFSTLLARLNVIETTQLPTMATDGRNLFWNRDFVNSLTTGEAAWVVLHEAGHCFLGHHLRLRGKDREQANIAFDLALNHIISGRVPSDKLRKMVLLPGQGPHAHLPGGKDAEWYFDAITKKQDEAEKDQQQDQSEDQDGDQDEQDGEGKADSEAEEGGEEGRDEQEGGDSASEGSDASEGSEGGEDGQGGEEGGEDGASGSDGDGEGGDKEGEGKTPGSSQSGESEGAGEGQAKPGDLGEGGQRIGEVLEAPEGTDPKEEEARWKESVAQAVNTSRQHGTLPGWLKEMAEGILGKPAKTDWRPLLRRWLSQTTNQGFSYSRPSRRGGYRKDVILPCRRQRASTNGAVLVDTSGSMSGPQMNHALDEIQKIIAQFPGSSVTMFQADVRLVGEAKKFTAADFPIRVPQQWQGRGGTEMNGPMKDIARGNRFDWVVIISDMYWPTAHLANVGLPTILVSTNKKLPMNERPRFAAYIDAQD